MNYLSTIYSGLEDGFLTVWNLRTRQTRYYPVTDLDAAAVYMRAIAEVDNIYFGWGIQAEQVIDGRGKADNVTAIPGFFLDADLRSENEGVHSKNEQLPRSVDELLKLMADVGLPPPTALRNSGNGRYIDFLFPEPFRLTTPEERQAAQQLSSDFQRLVIREAKRRAGLHVDYTGDLARVTRMPGTKNHKTTPAKDVTLLHLDEGRRIGFAELREAVDAAMARLPTASAGGGRRTSKQMKPSKSEAGASGARSTPDPLWDSILGGCDWIRSLNEKKANLSEPDWYALASILGRCQDGARLFHEFSSADPRYDHDEARAKLDHALEYGPRTCANISEELGHEVCRRCPFYGQIASPIELGSRPEAISEFMRTHVFDLRTNRYVRLDDGSAFDPKTITNEYSHKMSSPHSDFMRDRFIRKVRKVEYIPGEVERFVQFGKDVVLNTWRSSTLVPELGPATLIHEHLRFLIGPGEVDHVLDVLAHAVQNPREKVRHAIVIGGRQGTGKSFLGTLLRIIFGSGNVRTVNAEGFDSKWTANLCGVQVLIGEELSLFDRSGSYEKMKVLVTEDMMQAEEKFMPVFDAPTPRLLIAFTNHRNPLNISPDDRRVFFTFSDAMAMDSSYYRRLFREGLREAPEFLHVLLNRDLSTFNAAAAPPQTAAKQELTMTSRSHVEQLILQMVEDREGVFARDIVSARDAHRALVGRLPDARLSEVVVARAMVRLGYLKFDQIRLNPGINNQARFRGYAVRDIEKWSTASNDNIRAELNQPLPGFHSGLAP